MQEHTLEIRAQFFSLVKMEQAYKTQLAYLEFMSEEIKVELPELDVLEVDNKLEQYSKGLLKLDEFKNSYVNECLEYEVVRNQTISWVEKQKPVIKSLGQLKTLLKDTLSGLKTTAYQLEIKRQKQQEEEISSFKTTLDVERAKRVAENEQKINSLLQDNLANSAEERQKREQAHYEKISTFRKDGATGSSEATKPQVKLQKLHMSVYAGQPCDFQRFWPQFLTEIDSANISQISKFNYLIELLKGKPKNDILGLPHNEDGYEEAKRILQEGYGKDTVVLKELIIQLQNMPVIRSIHQKQEINDFSSKFSRIVRTLKTMKKLESAEAFVHTTFEKLGPIRENLTASNDEWERWGMEDLANNLKKYVDRNNLNQEKTTSDYKFDKNSQANRYRQERPVETYRNSKFDKGYSSDWNNQGKWRSENRNNQNGKSTMFYNGDKASEKASENKSKCAFCGYFNHVAKDCLKVWT